MKGMHYLGTYDHPVDGTLYIYFYPKGNRFIHSHDNSTLHLKSYMDGGYSYYNKFMDTLRGRRSGTWAYTTYANTMKLWKKWTQESIK
jgi:hypothetical protein